MVKLARVVPHVPTFSVDDGFAYRVPDALEGVELGSIVRVPLGGRRVRGYVTHVSESTPQAERPLRDVLSRSGDLPVFDEELLTTLRWAAIHYVAPLAVLLSRCVPPHLPRRRKARPRGHLPQLVSPLPDLTAALAEGRHLRSRYVVTSATSADIVAPLVGPVLATERNVVVVTATFAEAAQLADDLQPVFPGRVRLATSKLSGKDRTAAWVDTATGKGLLLVGTSEVILWPGGAIGLAVIAGEGRRAMKARQTPTLGVREVLRRRSAVERFGLVMLGPVPSAEAIAMSDVTLPPGRVWPLVEVVDRSAEPPTPGMVTERARRSIAAVLARDLRAFVFVSRRGYAPAFRCVRCNALRRCPRCGAGPDRGDQCRRCGTHLGPCVTCGGRRFQALGAGVGRVVDELRRSFAAAVAEAGAGTPVVVGTERDLVGHPLVALAVAVDTDALLLAPHYRASEDALRVLARVASIIERKRGNRALVQTGMPAHPVVKALRSGKPVPFVEDELQMRRKDGFPPAGELLAIEVEGEPDEVDRELRQAAGEHPLLLGPAAATDRHRWLMQGSDLHGVRIRLRTLIQGWRDEGRRVRVDADPIDL